MKAHTSRFYSVLIPTLFLIVGCSSHGNSLYVDQESDHVRTCRIHYIVREVPWISEWFMRGTVESMLTYEPIVAADSIAINSLKELVDSLFLFSSADLTQVRSSWRTPETFINVRYLIIFDYDTRQDTLILASTPEEGMIMKKRLSYSDSVYFRMIDLIREYDHKWGEMFDEFCRDGVFLLPEDICHAYR